ncbi:mirror-image polydactyly gene 1 protein isoform X2 [Mugil cephalus]|nr:mirror-image polydactyly gene 1 protein isoform X2 [Mugil cephalus]
MYRANPRVNVELRQRLPSPDRRSVSPSVSPVLQRRSVSPPVSPPSSRTPGRVGLMDEDRPPSRGPSPRDEGGASRGHLVPGGDSPRLISPLTLDRDKNTSLLLKELDALREINAKLQEQLVQKEKELQSREVEEELREQQREAHDWGRAAVVLEEVLAAQKDRDQAVMSRLLLANQERDEALTLARRLQEAAQAEDVDLDDCDMDVDELLRCVCGADSVQDLQRFGSVLVQRLRLARQRRQDITAQEMKAVMEERDESVAKVRRWSRLTRAQL